MGLRTVGRRERGFPPTDCPWRMVAAWWSHCSSAGPRARLFVHVVCILRRVRSHTHATIGVYTHTYASFTRETLARVRYICLSSSVLLHLSPFAYLMLFFRPRLSRLSLTPVSFPRYCLCSARDWGLEATGRLACENNLLIVLYLLRPSVGQRSMQCSLLVVLS